MFLILTCRKTRTPRELLAELMEETRELAYKHSVKANAIEEQVYLNPETMFMEHSTALWEMQPHPCSSFLPTVHNISCVVRST
jgi:hypothetical protein